MAWQNIGLFLWKVGNKIESIIDNCALIPRVTLKLIVSTVQYSDIVKIYDSVSLAVLILFPHHLFLSFFLSQFHVIMFTSCDLFTGA